MPPQCTTTHGLTLTTINNKLKDSNQDMIIAAGDSFVWGSELADSPHGGPGGHSCSTFAALLSAGQEYKCVAYPGASNRDIAQQVHDHIEHSRDIRGVSRTENDNVSCAEYKRSGYFLRTIEQQKFYSGMALRVKKRLKPRALGMQVDGLWGER